MTGLTPSQDTLVDLLLARYRLGESEWPIHNDLRRTIHALADKGYVTYRSGVVERTTLVRLTDTAVKELTSDSNYVPQGYKAHAETIASYLDGIGYDPNAGKMIRAKFGLYGTVA